MSTASNKVLILFGPTAVGKTAFLQQLSSDARLKKKIVLVSADSAQVYRGLAIGTAKPSAAEQALIRHELIDIVNPDAEFSVADFFYAAETACTKAAVEGCLPVISGGTAFYIKAFLYGLSSAPPADCHIRSQIQTELKQHGAAYLFEELRRLDPDRAARLSPNDTYRVSRALEINRSTGLPVAAFALPQTKRPQWNSLIIGLERPRAELYERINARVDAMFAAGLEHEVRSLIAEGYDAHSPGMKAIGYAEFFSEQSSEEIRRAIKTNSRHYAKRQLTFMKRMEDVNWYQADEYEAIVALVTRWLTS